MIQDKRFALTFRAGAFLFAAAGLLKQIGAFGGTISLRSFMYYTIQSNLLAVLLFAFLVVKTVKSLREGTHGICGWHPRLGMICAVDLLLTLVVFWAVLVPQGIDPNYLWTFENIAVHTITPLLCLLDYIFFSEARRLKYRDVYYVCIFPMCYLLFTSIAGLAGYVYSYSDIFSDSVAINIDAAPVRFPYFFLDFDRIGMMAAVFIIGIMVFFLLISHGIYWIDHKVRKPNT